MIDDMGQNFQCHIEPSEPLKKHDFSNQPRRKQWKTGVQNKFLEMFFNFLTKSITGRFFLQVIAAILL